MKIEELRRDAKYLAQIYALKLTVFELENKLERLRGQWRKVNEPIPHTTTRECLACGLPMVLVHRPGWQKRKYHPACAANRRRRNA